MPPILATKLYIPPPQPALVARPRLSARLNDALHRKLTLISAPAGFGKTTLVSEWITAGGRPTAWLSLDEADNDPARFLTYLVAALQTIAPHFGAALLRSLQSPQPPPSESILTALLNEIAIIPGHFILVLDDYHVLDSKPIDQALAFLIEHLPPQMLLVITTREDPQLPLAKMRARGQLTELRIADLRFTASEAAEFLNRAMGLTLSPADIAALEARTEGWIAGLQLAALSLQGHTDAAGFIQSFTGSHRFVLDYLVEEVLQRQSEDIQTFLLRTSILDRMCGPLCDAVLAMAEEQTNSESPPSRASAHPLRYASGRLRDGAEQAARTGSAGVLESLEHANLFIVPLDNERCWYRYHHLFADLLRQRLQQSIAATASDAERLIAELHVRASVWYEANGLELEAFQHAAAAHDIARAERLIEGKGMPLHFRGAVAPVLHWLESLPPAILDAWPSLWTSYASVLLVTGQGNKVERTILAAEAAVQAAEPNAKTRDLVGRLAAIRATVAVNENQLEAIISLSNRALAYLHPANLAFRTSTAWKLAFAYQVQGDRAAARRAYTEVIATGQSSGNTIYTLLATIGLGILQESDNQLGAAAKIHMDVLQLMGDQPLPFAFQSHLGLARIQYQWNDLAAAGQHAQRAAQLARQIEHNDSLVSCDVFLARLKLVQGDAAGALETLAAAEQYAREHNFAMRLPEVAAFQVLALLRQGNLAAAAELARTHANPLSLARVYLAQGDESAALTLLDLRLREVEAKGWADERIKVLVLQALAQQANGAKAMALQALAAALALAEPGGFIRLFVDEGRPMAQLLSAAAARGIRPDYSAKLLDVFEAELPGETPTRLSATQPLIEPLSQRELEVLQLIAQGLSNHAISEKLFLALDTVKGHNQKIFGKLQVRRRTEAVARARELGLL